MYHGRRFLIPRAVEERGFLVIPDEIEEEMYRHVLKAKGEAGGLLLGERIQIAGEQRIVVRKITTPKECDVCLQTEFILRDPGHWEDVRRAFNESEGRIDEIGCWHSHPEDVPTASLTDLTTWHEAALSWEGNALSCMAGIILGREGMRAWLAGPEFPWPIPVVEG